MEGGWLSPRVWMVIRSLLASVVAVLFAELATEVAWATARSFALSESSIGLFPIRTLLMAIAAGAATFFLAQRSEYWVLTGLCVGLFVGLWPQFFEMVLGLVHGVSETTGSPLIEALRSILVLVVSVLGARTGRCRLVGRAASSES